MLELAARYAPEADVQPLALPDDQVPKADAIVRLGHVRNYLPGEEADEGALANAARALRPAGVLAIDLCDLEWGEERLDATTRGWVGDDWALVTEFSVPSRDRFVRQMAIFIRDDDGSWNLGRRAPRERPGRYGPSRSAARPVRCRGHG